LVKSACTAIEFAACCVAWRFMSQVMLAQRLGYANVFDALRPAMHYRLRMWRADDHQVTLLLRSGSASSAWVL
jgi:hypothetical protein